MRKLREHGDTNEGERVNEGERDVGQIVDLVPEIWGISLEEITRGSNQDKRTRGRRYSTSEENEVSRMKENHLGIDMRCKIHNDNGHLKRLP